jgi:hypothetical protein
MGAVHGWRYAAAWLTAGMRPAARVCPLLSTPFCSHPCASSRWSCCLPAAVREDPAADIPRGTRITLHLKPDATEFADQARLQVGKSEVKQLGQSPLY